MAIIGPTQLPAVLKADSNPLKLRVLHHFGHPNVNVELTEDQLEEMLRVTGDFIVQYFPMEERYAYFYTQPLVEEYDLPADAYWVREIAWDPVSNRIQDIFGAEMFLFSVGNITGIQNLLTDYHLLQAYRKFSQKVLGTDGSWEITGDNKIRLKPTPKGSFPVVVRYLPTVNDFQIPSHKEVVTRALIAEAKIILGHTRRKLSLPSSDGGTIQLDGSELVSEGREEKKEIIELAISLGEPLGFIIK
jgi:hypothetical protein